MDGTCFKIQKPTARLQNQRIICKIYIRNIETFTFHGPKSENFTSKRHVTIIYNRLQ